MICVAQNLVYHKKRYEHIESNFFTEFEHLFEELHLFRHKKAYNSFFAQNFYVIKWKIYLSCTQFNALSIKHISRNSPQNLFSSSLRFRVCSSQLTKLLEIHFNFM